MSDNDYIEEALADAWATKVETDIAQLMKNDKTLRYAAMGLGAGVMLLAAAVGASTKVFMKGLTQLGANQAALAQAMGLVATQPTTEGNVPQPTVHKPDQGIDETKDAPITGDVAKPFDQPVQQASADVVKMMEEDAKNGLSPLNIAKIDPLNMSALQEPVRDDLPPATGIGMAPQN